MRGAAILAALAVAAGAAQAGARDEYVMRFDLFSPAGMDCRVDAPGAQVKNGRDLFGRPFIHILGDARSAAILCTAPDGSHWQATAQRTARYTPAEATYGTVVWRPGQRATMTIVDLGDRTDYQHKTFVRVD